MTVVPDVPSLPAVPRDRPVTEILEGVLTRGRIDRFNADVEPAPATLQAGSTDLGLGA